MIEPAFIASHAPTGCYWQPCGCWTVFCVCGETFDGDTNEAARETWAAHLADVINNADAPKGDHP